jgi:predicted O-linked N-acetylglucosamine transferase (SPINDLY family)
VDLVLDVLPFGGHTSTCEALWMGVPTVTLAGADFAGRMGASVMGMAGLAEFAADTETGYVDIAARWAADAAGLAALRADLRNRLQASRLLDATACARQMEAAYRDMWRGWLTGEGFPAG